MHSRRYILAFAIGASLLANGCYCPMLSGRYSDIGCCPPPVLRACPPACAPLEPANCLPPDSNCPPANPIGPPTNSAGNAVAADCPPDCELCGGPCRQLFGHHCCLSRWLTLGFGPGKVPSQQAPDYYSPPAKFHPVPTRPAFEPLPSYPPLLPAAAGMNNPLRATTSPPTAPLTR